MSGLRFVKRAAQRGIPIAIVTKGPTRGDELASVRLDAPITPVLVALTRALSLGAPVSGWADPLDPAQDGSYLSQDGGVVAVDR